MSAASVAGGPGNVTVANNSSTSVNDSSAASSQSGISVALAPTAVASPSPDTAITTAASGGSSATGVTASNDVSHTAVVGVSVGGGSQAPVNVTSNASVLVQDQGASAAVSGQAWAVAPGATGSPSGVTAPVVTGASGPTSPDVTSTGLQAQNDLSTAAHNTVDTVGGPQATAPIVITPDEVASVTARGIVNVASTSAACVTTSCQAAGPSSAVGSQAASGTADTRGLVAQNVVNTQAAVGVHVGGRNFSPIQIIVDSITKIVNLGIASSQTGDATAGAGGTGASSAALAGQAVASGNVQATGAQVRNNVDLRSSATVHVLGDNYSPIDIVLNLATTLFNRGIAIATSGDAQSSANGGAGASSSGAADATGLQAMNLVNMYADASVDVDGNNYAPIIVEVHFKTTIDNIGIGVATSGNVATGGSGTSGGSDSRTTPKTSTATNAATSGGSTQPGSAKGGDATAIANSVDAAFASAQLSNANGDQSQSVALITQMLRHLAPNTFDPFADPTSQPTPTPGAVQDGMNSSSGNTTSTGLHAAVQQNNAQLVACSDPGRNCTATNNASMSVAISDSPTNPAERGNPPPGGTTVGGSTASSGDALLNATPTPTPSTSTSKSSAGSSSNAQSSGSSGGRSSRGSSTRRLQFTSQTVATGLAVNGHTVLVDFWDTWPGRRLPPMPNMDSHTPTTSKVEVGANSWPGVDELPLPELTSSTTSAAPRVAGTRPSIALTGTNPSTDQPAESEQNAPLNVLSVYASDPFASWPAVDALPLPPQIVTAGAVAQPADAAPDSSDDTTPSIDYAALAELIAATLVGAVVAGVGSTRRGRHGVLMLWLRLRHLFSSSSSVLDAFNSLLRSLIR